MSKNRILVTIVIISTLICIISGCGISSKTKNTDTEISKIDDTDAETSNLFNVITIEDVGRYEQTIIYDNETMTEYLYLWDSGSGKTASTMLYMPDGSPKIYLGCNFKLILISTETVGMYRLSLMYDSENMVMYCASWNKSNGDVTVLSLHNADGTHKLYQQMD